MLSLQCDLTHMRCSSLAVQPAAARHSSPQRRFAVTLLDAPGHQDFVPNMITGAAQADAALLIVDGSPGGFESGFGSKSTAAPGGPPRSGQTREHVHIARSCGVRQLAVVVTKLDTCGYSQQRYDEIQAQLKPFLKNSGFQKVFWLPVSAPQGENVYKPPQDERLASWCPLNSSLVETIDKFDPAPRLSGVTACRELSSAAARLHAGCCLVSWCALHGSRGGLHCGKGAPVSAGVQWDESMCRGAVRTVCLASLQL